VSQDLGSRCWTACAVEVRFLMRLVRQARLKSHRRNATPLPKRQRRPQPTRVRLLLRVRDCRIEGEIGATDLIFVCAEVLSPKTNAGLFAKITLFREGHEIHNVDPRNSVGAIELTDDGHIRGTVILPIANWQGVFDGFRRDAYRFIEMDGTCWRLRRSKLRRVSFSRFAFRSSYPDVDLGVHGLEG
jgi:hypothetical protein